ncbi:MAG: hypothetical protein WAN60_07375 [Candidatus Sulfotelmatobacter sp.]
MSSKAIWSLVMLVVCACPLSASTYWVGTCHKGSFPTIMAAVTSSNVTPGSTVNVCPGLYQEQVIISKPLTLRGTVAAGSSLVTIYPPTNPSVTESPVLIQELVPIVWVTTGPVTIQDINVDTTASCPTPPQVGFYYAGASGKLNGVTFESLENGSPYCPGWGIWVENANSDTTSVTISDSFSDSGIIAVAQEPLPNVRLTVNITGNQLLINWALPAGIYLSDVGGVVSGNFIHPVPGLQLNPYVGIIDDAPSATISGNTIVGEYPAQQLGWGIEITQDGATVKSNKITNVSDAVVLRCHSATVTGNTITLAQDGIFGVPSSFAGSNTFRLVGTDLANNDCP